MRGSAGAGATASDGLASDEGAWAATGLAVAAAVLVLLSSTSPSSTSAVVKRLGVDAPWGLFKISF